MRRTFAFAILLGIAGLFAAGCPGAPSGLPTGTQLSEDQRMAVLDSSAEMLETLAGKSRDEIGQAMLDWIKSRPEFSESGLTDEGDVWAHYTDGQLFLVPTNVDLTVVDLGTPKPKYDHRAEKTLELPSTLNARLASVRGQNIAPYVDLFGGWLRDAGYNVALSHELDVEGYRSINGSHSIVYFDTHGIRLSPNSKYNPGASHRFFLGTNTYLTATVKATYQSEIDSGDLLPVPAFFGFVTSGGFVVRAKPTLLISASFVRKNMKFARDSFVFVNACSSYSTDFRDACFEAGASVYAGWSQPVRNLDCLNAGVRLFDGILGGNRDHPPTPRSAAQTWVAVYNEMKSEGTDIVPGAHGGQTQIILAENPNSNGGDFAQFSPSISGRMRVDEAKGQLEVNGFFGSRPGKVTMNGTELQLVGEWGPTRLTCQIPSSGANAAGDVQVSVDGRPSNHANLTMWEGTLNLMSDGAGSLTTTAEISVRLRGDVRYDLTPDAQSLSASTIGIWEANTDSICKVNAFGENTDGSTHTTYELSGSSEIELNRGFHDGIHPDYIYRGELVPAERKLYFLFEVRGVGKNISTTSFGDGPGNPTPSVIGFWSSEFFEGVSPHKYEVPLVFGSDYSIAGGSANAHDLAGVPLTLTWSSMTAQHPPDITQGR